MRKKSTGMALATIFEESEPVVSPSGRYSVVVSSQNAGPERSLSQAIVSQDNGGSGLIAFYEARVPMSFVWRGDDELVVRYPDDLPAPRIDATNDSYGLGGGGRVVYEPVPREQVAAVRWTRVGDFEVLSEEQCERGVLVTIRTGKRREHCYSYYDVREGDASTALLQARGLQGGGESWASVVQALVALKKPAIALDIELDPEGDGLAVRSRKRSALVEVAKLVAAAKRDETLLLLALEHARRAGELE
jgi:hypothetical protein